MQVKDLVKTYVVTDLGEASKKHSEKLAAIFCDPDKPIEDRLAARSNYVLDFGPLDASMKLMADAAAEIRRLKGEAS